MEREPENMGEFDGLERLFCGDDSWAGSQRLDSGTPGPA